MAQAHEDLEERLLHRLLFFTDAVFAIVLTLLVLELKPPERLPAAEEFAVLSHIVGRLFAFAMSFALVSIFWMAHMNTTSVLRKFDWPTAITNLAFLFPICLIPFVSAWLGSGFGDLLTWRMYCWTLIATSLGNVALVLVISRNGGRLTGGVTPRQLAHRAVRAASPGMAFGIGLILLSQGWIVPSQFCWLLIPPFLWIEGRFASSEPNTVPARMRKPLRRSHPTKHKPSS
jgi:uncharacterized membrane protein